MKTLVIVDFLNITIRGTAAIPYLSFNGRTTNGLYGFCNQLAKVVNEHKPTHLAIVSDKRPYKRSELFSGYKSDRVQKDDNPFLQSLPETIEYCRTLIQKLAIPFVRIQGYEADDLFYYFCEKYHSSFDKIVVVSNDSDLYQLFKFPNVMMEKGKSGIYSLKEYKDQYNELPLEDWWKVGAIAGTHNAVPKLFPKEARIGEKKALKMVQNNWDNVYTEHKEILDRNRKLIELPFTPLEDESLLNFNRCDFLISNVIGYLERVYGFNVTSAMENMLMRLKNDINVVGV